MSAKRKSIHELEMAVMHAQGEYQSAFVRRTQMGHIHCSENELTRTRRRLHRAKERLALAKGEFVVDPETRALIDAAIALLPEEFGLGGYPGTVCRVSRTERAYVTKHTNGTTSVTLWIERRTPMGWEPFAKSTPEDLLDELT